MIKELKKNKKGFTLVELVVVIAILAILVTLLVPQIMGNVEEARINTEISNARTLASEITVYNALQEDPDDRVDATGTAPAGVTLAGTVTVLQFSDLASFKPNLKSDEFPDTDIVLIYLDSDGNAEILER